MTLKEKIFGLMPVLGRGTVELAVEACGPAAELPIDDKAAAINAHDALAGEKEGGTRGRFLHSAIVSIIATQESELAVKTESVNAGITLAYLGSIGHKYELTDKEKINVADYARFSDEARSRIS